MDKAEIHATNFLDGGGINGYKKLLKKLFFQMSADHGGGVAYAAFAEAYKNEENKLKNNGGI